MSAMFVKYIGNVECRRRISHAVKYYFIDKTFTNIVFELLHTGQTHETDELEHSAKKV